MGAREFLAAPPAVSLLLEWHPEFMREDRQRLLYEMLVGERRCRIERIEIDSATVTTGFDELRRVAHADIVARSI
jgi:hypothetical protein